MPFDGALTDAEKRWVGDHSAHPNPIAALAHAALLSCADTFIQKTKRSYLDTRGARRNLGRLNDELQDVQVSSGTDLPAGPPGTALGTLRPVMRWYIGGSDCCCVLCWPVVAVVASGSGWPVMVGVNTC